MMNAPPQSHESFHNGLVSWNSDLHSGETGKLLPSPSKSSEPASSTVPMLNRFTLFPKLTTEIRLQVWELESSIPRDLDVWTKRFGGGQCFRFATSKAVPSILHTNKESRTVGLKYYQLAFGTDLTFFHTGRFPVLPPRIYLNSRADRVCFFGTNIGESAEYISIMIDEYKITYLAVNVAGRGQSEDPWAREMLCLIDIEMQTGPSAWLNERIEEITLFYRPQAVDFGAVFSFTDFDDDYERAIRGRKDVAEIRALACSTKGLNEGLELCLAKDSLTHKRQHCLQSFDEEMATIKQNEDKRVDHDDHQGTAKPGEVQNEDEAPDGVDGTLYCAWVGGRDKTLTIRMATISVSHE
ncbi:hypothetical protein BKA64DRAFT_753472 [Cadophora sp. MPI-SDFR-AT-0126]|nr:hypothetical protein BKA64DRAFT_753472 [Leotiomycetes sp. MPI-SDFR-AT-0126]